uniref:Large ribosomal subunit protein eL6 n=1 Tax=Paramoeba aestuarina TaxID=180227 RepID=A0A7S4KDS1_9EUKA|eukprot:CAMPEP_0201506998 /NCGR_PEP_ID=MMETSP0161_2-20130828/807_1 /ASSEMBLY_ACC=CAM_ASM_000251 /TAXON_ID=180227 /ORGANISM="Neoparamoeba aestuarina, Strain SoJaBio B1-5/56/2" /LENGTH=183 /DNA_ID=CAMNT_0047901255 /DNA_START=70 /DNA_END=621 /DNA_ORIENTATION=+
MAKAKKVSTKKEPRFYPTEKTHKRLHRNAKPKVGKTRDSITAGTVLVLLSGRFRGKRVVYLKTLPSGLLLVTGPFKVNGVPLRRVNQAYVAATSTKIDISKVSIPEISDKDFKKPKKVTHAKTEGEFFADQKEKAPLPEAVKANQKKVDAAILEAAKAVPHMTDYLHARFSLRNGEYPHLMKF